MLAADSTRQPCDSSDPYERHGSGIPSLGSPTGDPFGHAAEAGQPAVAALGLSSGRDGQYEAALALALSGDAALAQALANDLSERYPEATIAQFKELPTLHARLALTRNDPSRALEALQAPAPTNWKGTDSKIPPACIPWVCAASLSGSA
jgi:hypothetical protein